MRTSPPVPKTVPAPQRLNNAVPAPRRSAHPVRNGGEAELVELNQQVLCLRYAVVLAQMQIKTKRTNRCIILTEHPQNI